MDEHEDEATVERIYAVSDIHGYLEPRRLF